MAAKYTKFNSREKENSSEKEMDFPNIDSNSWKSAQSIYKIHEINTRENNARLKTAKSVKIKPCEN